MGNIHKLILDEFSTSTIESIIDFGKYNLHGFRVNGPSSKAKTSKMKSVLLGDKNFGKTLFDYANSEVEKQSIDNTWTLVNEIDFKVLNEKLRLSKKQNVILELLSGKRVDIVEEILTVNEELKKEVAATKEMDKEEDIDTLRTIIKKLEDEKRKLQKAKEKEQNNFYKLNTALTSTKQEKEELKVKISKTKREIKDVESRIDSLEKENYNLEQQLNGKKNSITKLEKELKQICVLIFGGEKTREWFEDNNGRDKYNFTFADGNLDVGFYQNKMDEVWVIRSHIGTGAIKKIKDTEVFNKFKSVERVRFFDKFDAIKDYMNKLEELL